MIMQPTMAVATVITTQTSWFGLGGSLGSEWKNTTENEHRLVSYLLIVWKDSCDIPSHYIPVRDDDVSTTEQNKTRPCVYLIGCTLCLGYIASQATQSILIIQCNKNNIDTLWLSDTIWLHRCGSTLAEVMGCCLIAPSHYLNQYWSIIKVVLWHSPESNFTKGAHELYPTHMFKDYIFDINTTSPSS